MDGIISLCVFLFLTTGHAVFGQNTTSSSPDQTTTDSSINRTHCPEVMCTREFIPEACREIQVIVVNGNECYGCPQWKSSCKTDGVTHNKATRTLCPETVCTLEFIPDECREVPKTDVNGIQCDGCPRWRTGCKEKAASSVTNGDQFAPRVACPLLNCGMPIPPECRVEKTFTTRGQVCSVCPDWRKNCREEERLVFINTPRGAVPRSCPKFPCAVKVPVECQEVEPFNFRGRQCFRCPTWREGCLDPAGISKDQSVIESKSPEMACPLMNCERTPGVHRSCYQKETFMFRGKTCHGCPSIKKECLDMVPPKPVIPVDGFPSFPGKVPEIACPLLACPAIFIPNECRETPMYEVYGKQCQACPKHIEGCVPSSSGGQGVIIADTKQPTVRKVACPLKACTLMLIPPECRDEQPYDFNGQTCYDCPKWRDGCVPNRNAVISNQANPNQKVPDMSCPLFGCPKMFIPPECREAQPFQFQGKTCFKCPKWKEGCVPAGSKMKSNGVPQILPLKPSVEALPVKPDLACPLKRCMKLDVPANCLVEQTFDFQGRKCVDCPTVKPGCTILPVTNPCPVLPCPKIYIPDECREQESYEYNGNTCYRCPKRRSGCTSVSTKNQQSSVQSSDFAIPPNGMPANDPNSLLNLLRGPIPVQEIMSQVNTISCPPLPCPDMLIPAPCKEETTYLYQGRVCRGCPVWRFGCQPSGGIPMNMNANGILSFSLFNEMFVRK